MSESQRRSVGFPTAERYTSHDPSPVHLFANCLSSTPHFLIKTDFVLSQISKENKPFSPSSPPPLRPPALAPPPPRPRALAPPPPRPRALALPPPRPRALAGAVSTLPSSPNAASTSSSISSRLSKSKGNGQCRSDDDWLCYETNSCRGLCQERCFTYLPYIKWFGVCSSHI